MLGYNTLSEAPLSALASSNNVVFSVGTANGTCLVTSGGVNIVYSVGTAAGTCQVTSINQAIERLSILRGMSKQLVNSTATMSDNPISLLESFI